MLRLAQFGLTPKSKRGLASSDPGDAADPLDELRAARCVLHCALHYSLSARPSLRASVTAPLRTSLALLDSASGDFT